jgi:hypothetical protein
MTGAGLQKTEHSRVWATGSIQLSFQWLGLGSGETEEWASADQVPIPIRPPAGSASWSLYFPCPAFQD